MGQFECKICGQGFEQKSRYENHMMTSHPLQAVSTADIKRSIKGLNFPASKEDLIIRAKAVEELQVAEVMDDLPDMQYRDSAEVARAFGSIRSHEKKPTFQPSRKGGKAAMKTRSAAKIARLFSGIRFPVSGKELKKFAHKQKEASDKDLKAIEKFSTRTYQDMSDVEKEFKKAISA